MKVAILAGGLGSRLAEETDVRPKPMVEIGGKPILWHIMMHYAHYGYNDFVIGLGYRGEVIKKYMIDYCSLNRDLRVSTATGKVKMSGSPVEDWTVELIDTGIQTQTGGRIKRLAPFLGHETFMLTWGDGVSNLNFDDLLAFHRRHGKLATLTAVRPTARFGHLEMAGRPDCRILREAADERGLDQRRILRFGAWSLRLYRRRRYPLGERTAGAPGKRRSAHGLPPPGFLAMHGYDPRKAIPGEFVGGRQRTLEDMGGKRCAYW